VTATLFSSSGTFRSTLAAFSARENTRYLANRLEIRRPRLWISRTVTELLGNDRGIQIRSSNNQALDNLIAGNRYDGITLWESSSGNLIQGNTVALNAWGPVGCLCDASFNGVGVYDGSGNRVLSNSIFGNGILGIHIGRSSGVLPNDAGDLDTGANGLQNYPTLTSAVRSNTTTTITGSLNSTASTSFIVQFFANPQCDASGYGEGRYFLGQTIVTTNAAGDAPLNVDVGASLPAGWVVTSTVTSPDGDGNTSSFSACRAVQ